MKNRSITGPVNFDVGQTKPFKKMKEISESLTIGFNLIVHDLDLCVDAVKLLKINQNVKYNDWLDAWAVVNRIWEMAVVK